jgi:hypothetical protein
MLRCLMMSFLAKRAPDPREADPSDPSTFRQIAVPKCPTICPTGTLAGNCTLLKLLANRILKKSIDPPRGIEPLFQP